MTAKQKRSLFIRFGNLVVGKRQFRFESHLLPSQCAERIEKLAYSTFHHGYFAGQCRIVSLNRLDENAYDFVVETRTNDPLGYTLVSVKGHLDVDSLTAYTIIQGITSIGLTPLLICGLVALGAILVLKISLSRPIFILGLLPFAANSFVLLRYLCMERQFLFEDMANVITARKYTAS